MKHGSLLFLFVFVLVLSQAAAQAQYVGSGACKACHEKVYNSWRQTLHSRVIQDAAKNPQAVQGDFSIPFELKKFSKADVKLTHGVQWKQRYIDKDWHILPAQWNFLSNKWEPTPGYEGWEKTDWRKECGYCHNVGFDAKTNTFKELSVTCEACHGPGGRHVTAKEKVGSIINPAILPFDYQASICGQCHTRGKSPDGKAPNPVGFQPGDVLRPEHFTIVPKTDQAAWWPDGSVKQHRQQYPEWRGSRHAAAGVTCITCHAVHEAPFKFQTREAPNNLCIKCHSNVSTDSVTGHAPILGAPQHSDCIACHMAPTGKSADRGDERVHTFRVVRPEVTLKLGGGDISKQPNACNSCHWHKDTPPAKLQETLELGKKFRFQQR